MASARRKEGPRAPLFYSIPVLLLIGLSAMAQSVDMADLKICAALETNALKLACFEAIVASGRRGPEPTVPTAEIDAETQSEALPTVIESAKVTTGTAPAAIPGSGPIAAATDTSESDAAFGQEHLPEDDSEPETMTATVIEVTRNRNRIHTFHLDNGQEWRQTDDRYFSYPKDAEFDVTISKGMMGDYRLRVGGESRMLRVRRIR